MGIKGLVTCKLVFLVIKLLQYPFISGALSKEDEHKRAKEWYFFGVMYSYLRDFSVTGHGRQIDQLD